MSYNGSGTFVVNSSGQPVVTGTVISSTAFNALTADLATGLSTAITKDGQTTTTARILFAQGISSTLVTDATSATTGSIITAGGISCQKAAVVGTLLGVGMAPTNVLDITQTQDTASNISLRNSSTGTSASSRVYLGNSVSATSGRLITWGSGFTSTGVYRQDGLLLEGVGAGGVTISANAAQPIYFGINNVEKMRLDASGNFQYGTTTNVGSASFGTTIFSNGSVQVSQNTTGAAAVLAFYNPNGSVGSIQTSGSSTSYVTSSDYRLKENVQPMTGGLATVAALKPVNYDWIIDKSAGEGFIAHELQDVIPAAVTGEKDAVDDKGEIKPQGVDFSKIVPHLVAAIQELTTRLAALENK